MDPVFACAALLAAVGALGSFVLALRWIARKYERRIRHRMFDRSPPTRWPKTDFRVGRVIRPQDFR